MTEVPKQVVDYAPTLVFSKGEKYFPCDIFFAGSNVINNKQEYDKLSEEEKLGNILCYYHVNTGRKYIVYQYWYYYTYNPYRVLLFYNDHEHDFESAKIFVGKKSQKPEYIICNIHEKRNSSKIKNGEIPNIHVELGGHGLRPEKQSEPWVWFGEKDEDKRIKAVPKKPEHSCENLRLKVLKQPIGVIDTELRIVGNNFSPTRKAPQVPWIRSEYYLPEYMDEFTKIEKQKRESYIQPFGRIDTSIYVQLLMNYSEHLPISSFQFASKKNQKMNYSIKLQLFHLGYYMKVVSVLIVN